MMKEKILNNIDTMVDYLTLIRKEVEEGTPERVDSLDILSFVSVALDSTYQQIKEHFQIKEEE